jgi:2-polyprenyl-3-methyl-5-hydroxy-6-metoxy-1,4-benzoquinol methylase
LSYDEVVEGNVELHRQEAKFYDCIHDEIWNRHEQKRLLNTIKFAVSQISENNFRAVDFGAGTGNVTEKLLDLGFEVVAIDISKEMCEVLKAKNRRALREGKLQVLNLNIDEKQVLGCFDFVACYSVLHHLPDYIRTIRELLHLVKEGGVFYVDHEPAPKVKPKDTYNILARAVMFSYYFTNALLSALYLYGIDTGQKLDYKKADIHNTLDYRRIQQALKREGFKIIKLAVYYAQETWFNTPLNFLHKAIVRTNETMIIAKKVRSPTPNRSARESTPYANVIARN